MSDELFTQEMYNELLRSQRMPHEMIQSLLGCSWGRQVCEPDDNEPCPLKADRIVIIHTETGAMELKLCQKHGEHVLEETTPHVFDT